MKYIKRMSALCYLNNGRLLCYKYGSLYFLDSASFKVIEKVELFPTFKEKYLARLKMIYRLFRFGVRTAIQISDHIVLLFVNKKIYEFDIISTKLSEGYIPEPGIRPLKFTNITGIRNFTNMTVFGGYLSNSSKSEVHIYKRKETDNWEIIYTFEKGMINHIHNIVPDKDNNCVWVLTGDFDDSAAIWKFTNNFSVFDRVFYGSQIFRGCVAFPINGGLLYATDTPFANNSIRFLSNDGESWESNEIMAISGSCIYGCKIKEEYVFSTAVEGDGRNSGFLKLLKDRTRGSGIKDEKSHLYVGNLSSGFKDIYQVQKDSLPFIFQFGILRFPEGINNTDFIVTEHVALKRKDLCLVAIPYTNNINNNNRYN